MIRIKTFVLHREVLYSDMSREQISIGYKWIDVHKLSKFVYRSLPVSVDVVCPAASATSGVYLVTISLIYETLTFETVIFCCDRRPQHS